MSTDKAYISNGRAAWPLLPQLQTVDIRQFRAADLDPLLREETAEWRSKLDWDFSKSADLVRTLADKGWLNGLALVAGSQIAGYGYTGLEGRNASIWDIYLRRAWRSGNSEQLLLKAVFNALINSAAVDRIESQLMLVEAASAEALQRQHVVRLFERVLMTLDARAPAPPASASTLQPFHIEEWENGAYDAAGGVISLAYSGHIDATIHEHYCSQAEAGRYVYNLVHFPGCASFHPAASCLAFDRLSGQIAGIALTAFIALGVAHIAELCVVPQFQGIGLGYELLRRSIESLRTAGAQWISVTVSAANHPAVRLYRRFGFREMHRFHAYLWERSGGPAGNNSRSSSGKQRRG